MSDQTFYSEEAKKKTQRQQIALGMASLVTGMGLGAVVALLFAPEDGESMRSRISNAMNEGQGKLEELITTLESEYPDLSERVRKAVDQAKQSTPGMGNGTPAEDESPASQI
ncbi:MAG: YtxH domain-containing protein [Anaerolineae bacterium]|nr:YtxH domain-containing protein [Anaerolineae bacterium]